MDSHPQHLHEQPGLVSPETQLARAAGELALRFGDAFSREVVERQVFDSYAELRRTAKITTHLQTLSIRFAKERLIALAEADRLAGSRPGARGG